MSRKLIFSTSLIIILFPLSFPFCEEMPLVKSYAKPFEIKKDFLYLSRFPTSNYFDQIGRKFAILGEETGDIEVWGFHLFDQCGQLELEVNTASGMKA